MYLKGAKSEASKTAAGADEPFIMLLVQQVGTWILIFTNFVPISLLVTLEVVKFWQVMFMTTDAMMYDEEQDMAM